MDSKNLNGVWKLKRFRVTCIELIFKFCVSAFCLQFEFFFNFNFQMHKTHLKSFAFEILFIGDYSLTFWQSLKNITFLASELQHFQNDVNFCQGI